MSRVDGTIFALSSGRTPSGVAVIRVSGPDVPDLLVDLCDGDLVERKAHLRSIHDREGNLIDQALVISFVAPRSFTGEHCVEFHLHGGRAVVNAMLALLSQRPGLRAADAGEFTRRAFENGKLDLVEIEGLSDLIAAETEMQRRLAIEQSRGGVSARYQGWMLQLTRARALIEAELDFPEEEDVPGSVSETVWKTVDLITADIGRYLDGQTSAEIVRDGFVVVIVGRPNAGKSSLLNALARRDVAIVTDVAGTTRDLISIDLDLGGYLVRFIDTAGLRQTNDVVEAEGIRRTRDSIDSADLVLVLKDIGDADGFEVVASGAKILNVVTKCDTSTGSSEGDTAEGLKLSAHTGYGIDSLTKQIQSIVEKTVNIEGQAISARHRQRDLLLRTQQTLQICLSGRTFDLEIRSEYLRQAAHLLGRITGHVDAEDLLDVIFSEFCIGK